MRFETTISVVIEARDYAEAVLVRNHVAECIESDHDEITETLTNEIQEVPVNATRCSVCRGMHGPERVHPCE